MGVFYSPMRLIELIKNKGSITEINKKHGADWYFTKEGEKAYTDAKTPAQKTMYFFDYLQAVVESTDIVEEIVYSVAYVMANSVDSSSLDFAGYPNILDTDKNPLIKCLKTPKFSMEQAVEKGIKLMLALDDEAGVVLDYALELEYKYLDDSFFLCLSYCVLLLSALNNEDDVDKYFDSSTRSALYGLLSQCSSDGNFTDKYKVERDIIGAFCSNIDRQYMIPYFRPAALASSIGEQN